MLYMACARYAIDHDNNFPPSLEALVPTYIQASALVSPVKPHEAVGYLYTPGLKFHDDPANVFNKVLIQDKFAPSIEHESVLVYADGSGGVSNIVQ